MPSGVYKRKEFSAEHKKRISESLKGKKLSAKTKLKMSKSQKGKKHSIEHKQKISESLKGRKFSAEHKQKISAANKIALTGRKLSESHKKALKRKWQNMEYRKKILCIATASAPNEKEKQLLGILESLFPNEYKFVGDGELMINGKIPDFVNVNGQKKIIELFGDYWHSEERVGKPREEHEKERVNIFSSIGYKTLVIWEHELENIKVLTQKLKEFHTI